MSNEELVRQHKEVCNMLNEIYEQKNRAYGNSFGDTYKDLGIISAVTRINDKFNRLKTLAKNKEINQGDESIADTLLDMANYCIMTYMELQNEKENVCGELVLNHGINKNPVLNTYNDILKKVLEENNTINLKENRHE